MLYKYTSSEYAFNLIKNEWLHFTKSSYLNDPFDCNPSSKVRHAESKKYIKDLEVKSNFKLQKDKPKDKLKELIKNAYRKDRNRQLILSLSENRNDIKMWSHYAESHKGVCIEVSEFPLSFKDLLLKVQYSDERPKISLQNIINFNPNNKADIIDVMKTFVFKSSSWKDEEEYRFVVRYDDEYLSKVTTKDTDNGVLVSGFKFSKVFLGINIDNAIKSQLIDLCNGKNIEVVELELDENNYSFSGNA